MAANGNKSNVLVWIIGGIVLAGGLFWAATILFPQLISQVASFLVGLFVVATGLFLRRKK